MNIEQKELDVFLNYFYNYYFVDYLEEILDDSEDELSAIIFMEGIDYFLDFCKKYKIELSFSDLKTYLDQNYFESDEIYKTIMDKYNKELKEYGDNFDFEDANRRIEY